MRSSGRQDGGSPAPGCGVSPLRASMKDLRRAEGRSASRAASLVSEPGRIKLEWLASMGGHPRPDRRRPLGACRRRRLAAGRRAPRAGGARGRLQRRAPCLAAAEARGFRPGPRRGHAPRHRRLERAPPPLRRPLQPLLRPLRGPGRHPPSGAVDVDPARLQRARLRRAAPAPGAPFGARKHEAMMQIHLRGMLVASQPSSSSWRRSPRSPGPGGDRHPVARGRNGSTSSGSSPTAPGTSPSAARCSRSSGSGGPRARD